MAENEVLRRRVVPEDEVYRQVFDAEVSYTRVLRGFLHITAFQSSDLGHNYLYINLFGTFLFISVLYLYIKQG